MTSEAPPAAERAVLEGTLDDLELFEVLDLLARGRHTGTLYLAGARSAAITLVDGEVSFATSDPKCSLREVLLARSVIDERGWNEAVHDHHGDLGAALVARSGADPTELRSVVHEHILETVHELADLHDGGFRFVLGSRHSMGPGYAYPIDQLHGGVAYRSEAWRSIRDVVPSTAAIACLNETAPPGETIVCIAATDWPVVAALDGQRSLRDVAESTGLATFTICQAVYRLVTAGLVTIVHDGAY
jgi:hypothetical protein